MKITRRNLIKLAGVATLTAAIGKIALTDKATENIATSSTAQAASIIQAPIVGSKNVTGTNFSGEAAKVYFTRQIDAEHLIQLYQKINSTIGGKVAIKLHSGEPHGPNILPRDMVQKFQAQIPNSTIIEANTAYGGARANTERHRQTLQVNGWTFSNVDIIDADGDINFPVQNGFHLNEVAMGSHLANYDSMIVLTHFKGHAMGGFGGSLKNIAIGCASGAKGKLQVHGVQDYGRWVGEDLFMELMADSGKAICDHFGKKIVYLNVMRRMSVDCDCAGTQAAEPTMADIGILASTDILAIDQACCDLVYNAPDSADLKQRIESRHGLRQLSAMAEHKMGCSQYELIEI